MFKLLRIFPTRDSILCSSRKKGLRIISSHWVHQCQRPYVDPKLSYAFGKSQDRLLYNNVGRQLELQVKETPDELAFISHVENKVVTLEQLGRDVNKLAKTLLTQFEISKGDNVGIYSYNCYNWLVAQFACARIGAVVTTINPSNKAEELAYILNNGKVKCLFTQGPKSPQAQLNNHLEVLKSERIENLAHDDKLELRNVILMDSESNYDSLLDTKAYKLAKSVRLHDWNFTQDNGRIYASVEDAEKAGMSESSAIVVDPCSVSPDDTFGIYYTSGTTGVPKGACISHFAALNNARLCSIRIKHGRPKSWKTHLATNLPLYHIFAGVLCAFYPIIGAGTAIFPGYKYDIKLLVESLIKYGCNMISLTPTILIDLLSYIEANKLNDQFSLKQIQSGGAPLPPEIVKRAHRLLPQLEEVRVGYGSTENGSISTLQSMHEPSNTKATSVGPPLDFTEVRVVKPGSDEILSLGEHGEIQTRGHNIMTEYLNQPEKTAEVITASRWYKTGDIGFMHPHGSIEISGRLKNLIIKGGENVYPQEVEQVILEFHGVEDAQVIGVPDPRLGEQICAWVKLEPGFRGQSRYSWYLTDNSGSEDNTVISDDHLIKFCKDKLTYFKVPKYIIFVDSFPLTATKKVQKHVMQEITCEKLNL